VEESAIPAILHPKLVSEERFPHPSLPGFQVTPISLIEMGLGKLITGSFVLA